MREQYERITSLEAWEGLGSESLAEAASEWRKSRATITDDAEMLREFNERLAREWSIETGIIEAVYTLTKGTTVTLIEHGFKAGLVAHGESNLPEEELYSILEDQKSALDWVFSFVKDERMLSTSYIKELHALLTRHQKTCTGVDQFGQTVQMPLISGDWKTQYNNPTQPDGSVFYYCPPEQVASEMDNLVAWYQVLAEQEGMPSDVLAAWLHHRFTLVHPFQDGNGRVARALASLVFIKAGLFPLVVKRENRSEYIDALKAADDGDLLPLVRCFADEQQAIAYRAIDTAKILRAGREGAPELYSGKFKEKEFVAGRASVLNKTAAALMQYAQELLVEKAVPIDKRVKSVNPDYGAYVYSNSLKGGKMEAFKKITEHRGDLKTKALAAPSAQLIIDAGSYYEVTFVAIPTDGKKETFKVAVCVWSVVEKSKLVPPSDIMGIRRLATAFTKEGWVEEGYTSYEDKTLVTNSPFVFSASENIETVKSRFTEWLEGAMVLASAELERHQQE